MEQLKSDLSKLIAKAQREAEENADEPEIMTACEAKIERANLRLSLLEKSGDLSLLRLAHLEEIFKHYCANVFRVGKHMTFDRLEYDRVHMTLDRFALFLRDFQLTSFLVEGKPKEVLTKQTVVSVFKKVSSNCRELSFEEFIQCIEKLAVVYFDQKHTFFEREKLEAKLKQKRKAMAMKNKARREQALKDVIGVPPLPQEEVEEKEEENEEQIIDPEESQVRSNEDFEKPIPNYNDELVNELINDKSIEDPNEEVTLYAEEAKREKKELHEKNEKSNREEKALLELSPGEKAEHFYSLINVDSLEDYKHKLTTLHLPIFKTTPEELYFKRERKSTFENHSIEENQRSEQKSLSPEEQKRILQLKEKMLMQKEKLKSKPIPKPNNEQALKESENSKKRKELKRMREEELKISKEEKGKAIKNETQPKVEFKETEISWEMLEKLNIDQLKLRQFNPAKLFVASDDDSIFLNEYGGNKAVKNIEIRGKQSQSVASNVKKRADEVQMSELKHEKEIRRRALV